jgi:oxygen-independent coproporphyrinogen-3 oxidase
VHTPFCKKKCYYCVYGSNVAKSDAEVISFYDNVITEQISQYKPIFDNVQFQQVNFGGGTPTILPANEIEKLYNKIPNFKSIPFKGTEASPTTITKEHIELYKEFDFSYVSLGVQTLSEGLLKANNREVVSIQKLKDIFEELDKSSIVYNMDLIFFLESGTKEDMKQAYLDLNTTLGVLKPISVTIQSNYLYKKSIERQTLMLDLIGELTDKYPEYSCVNSVLSESNIEYDMKHGAEYKLFRKNKDFNYYYLSKCPTAYVFGCNMIGLGEFKNFEPRNNFYYISDFIDKYGFSQFYKKYELLNDDFENTREKLGLKYKEYSALESFFKTEEDEGKFKQIIKEANIPKLNIGN